MKANAAPVSSPVFSAPAPTLESAWSLPVTYEVATRWEEFINEEYRQALITRRV